jgi:hypothetical protein
VATGIALTGVALVAGCSDRERSGARIGSPAASAAVDRAAAHGAAPAAPDDAPPLAEASQAAIRRFCGDCHPLPLPSSFPRDAWHKEVRQGYDLYLASGRSDLPRPVERDAVRFFAATAPERLAIPRAADREEPPSPVRFEEAPLPEEERRVDPAITQVVAEPAGGLLTVDMRHGDIRRWQAGPAGLSSRVVAQSGHPCRIMPAGGLAGDAADRYLLADLGSFLPEDHARGGVFDLDVGPRASTADGPRAAPRRLVGRMSRVVEARPHDFDGDGRDDLLVAEFGWLATGSLRVFLTGERGAGTGGGPAGDDPTGDTAAAPERGRVAGPAARTIPPAEAPGFREVVLDPRHGPLGVRVADLDGDGRDDIVAAFAQEHETVDVWWNRGGGRHEHQTLLSLPDPSYGSSTFDVADLDGDGRPDILHANGDTMDSGLAKPYHAIRRLLNRGADGFVLEEIAAFTGVCQASAADVDQDGDLDIVAASLHPAAVLATPGTFDALIWLEQLADGSYRRHTIERDRCDHAAFAIADVDGDGRPDVVAGNWLPEEDGRPRPPLAVFLNRAAAAGPVPRLARRPRRRQE